MDWINVADRLPDRQYWVLAHVMDGSPCDAVRVLAYDADNHEWYGMAGMRGYARDRRHRVSHWMELPFRPVVAAD
jgi:hypothetical protein